MEHNYFHEGLIREDAEGAVLIGRRCRSCGRILFPVGQFCPDCLCRELDEVPFGRTGTLFSYTTTYGPAAKLRWPFSVGYIDTPEGVRVFAPLRMEEGRPFAIGQAVTLEIAELWDENGEGVYGYQYRIAEGGGEA